MAAKTRGLLLDQLRDSGLLQPDQLKELARLPEARERDPGALARQVKQRGWLTPFQINRVAQGRAAELFVGPYVLLDRLGEGGMGQVYKARHRHMERVVALKVIRKDKLRSAEAVQRFYQEVQAAAHLSHPNIVLAYDAGEAGGTHFLSMEYVEGYDLARMVKEDGPLPVARACDYVRQAALGLQHAHERGMVHRDIKPHNLLVAPAESGAPGWGTVKVLDMGLARLNQGLSGRDRQLTQTGTVLGTPDYLAPEQALNARSADIRSDLYALGCTLYYLLAGRAPFHAESLTQLLLKHQMEEPAPLEALRPDVPAGVAELVRRLLAKRPEDRPQTPAEVAAALEPYCAPDGSPAPTAVRTRPAPSAHENSWATLVGDEVRPAPARARSRTTDGTLVAESGARGRAARGTVGRKVLIFGLIGAALAVPLVVLVAAGIGVLMWRAKAVPPHSGTARDVVKVPVAPAPQPQPVPEVPRQPAPEPPAKPPEPPPEQPPPRVVPQPPPPTEATRPAPPTSPEVRRFGGSLIAVSDLPFSPDGRRLGFPYAQVPWVWDVATGAEVNRLGVHPLGFSCGVFGPDGKRLFMGCDDHAVYSWDLQPPQLTRLFQAESRIACLALSPDGRRLLAGSGRKVIEDGRPVVSDCLVRVWDVPGRREVCRFTGHAGPVFQVEVSADGRRALSLADTSLCLWDPRTGQEIRRLSPGGMLQGVRRACLSADGRQALLIVQTQGKAKLWDVDADREVLSFGDPAERLTTGALAPDGLHAVTATHRLGQVNRKVGETDCLLHLWDARTGKELRRFEGHTRTIIGVSIAPDGRQAASSSFDGTVRVWDLFPGNPVVGRRPGVPPTPALAKKAAVPDKGEQEEAEKLVKKRYEAEYKKPAERAALAAKLLEKAKATTDDPAGRYVLLREARDLAAQAGDAPAALLAADQLAQLYEVEDAAGMRLTALEGSAKAAATPAATRAVAEAGLALLEESLAADDFDRVATLEGLIEPAARKAQSSALSKVVEARLKEVAEARKDHEAAQAAAATLKDKPDDPTANLAVGKYQCFRKGDWDKGLLHLVKGGDEDLRAAARADLDRPARAEEQVRAGDAWWKLAESHPDLGKPALLRRAGYWYEQALDGVAGLTRDRLEERIKVVHDQDQERKPAGTVAEARSLTGHLGPVTALAAARDGRRLLSGGADGTVRLWDVVKGQQLRLFDGARGEVRRVALAPNGRVAAAAGTDGVWLWDADTGERVQQLPFGGQTNGVVFSADSKTVVMCGQRGALQSWKLDERRFGRSVSNPNWGLVRSLAALPGDRLYLFVPDDGTARVYDLTDYKELGKPIRSSAAIAQVVAAPSGLELAAVTDRVVQIWSLKNGLPGRIFRHPGRVHDVAYSPDGHLLLTACDDKLVRLWDARTGREARRFSGHAEAVRSVAFSGDGRLAFSASDDKTIRVWELAR
jgi:WD40 repeat protein/serine/threonine protein kinase